MRIFGIPAICLFFIVFSCDLRGQNPDIRKIIEDLTGVLVEEDDYYPAIEEITEKLFYYSEHRIDLNIATEDELADLHLLNTFQIKSLRDYIRKNGKLQSVYEMQLVFGFSRELVSRLKPFVKVSLENLRTERRLSELKPAGLIKYGSHQLLFRAERLLETQKGYLNKEEHPEQGNFYPGDPYKLYTQYKYHLSRRLFLGFTAEKDPGEEFFAGSNYYGFDFYSFHFLYQGDSWLKTLALGDYRINFGQGLTAWSSMNFDKSPYVLNIMRKERPVKKYSSSDENRFFRGAALTISHRNTDYSFFYSNKNRDANLVAQQEGDLIFSSFQQTGYHRLNSEINDEGILNEQVMGGNISFREDHFQLGLSAVYSLFEGKLENDAEPYRYFRFSGSENFSMGLDYKYSFKRYLFFGEFATSDRWKMAFLHGVQARLSERVGTALLFRNYHLAYQSLYAAPFSESSHAQNETGVYLGVKMEIFPWLTSSAYLDGYRHSWLNYLTDAPSEGWSSLVNVDFPVKENFQFNFRYQYSQEGSNDMDNESLLSQLINEKQYKMRLNVRYNFSDYISLQNRISFTECFTRNKEYEQGLLIYQDLSFKLKKWPLQVDARYGIFDTDSYHSRLYAYEQDLLYNFSIPAYYFRGFRYYMNLKYSQDFFTLYLKFGRTCFLDKESIGTGLSQIDGYTKTRIKMQLRLKW